MLVLLPHAKTNARSEGAGNYVLVFSPVKFMTIDLWSINKKFVAGLLVSLPPLSR